jgi:hypothetical protein
VPSTERTGSRVWCLRMGAQSIRAGDTRPVLGGPQVALGLIRLLLGHSESGPETALGRACLRILVVRSPSPCLDCKARTVVLNLFSRRQK